MLKNIRWFICKNYTLSKLLLVFVVVLLSDMLYISSKLSIVGADTFTLLFQGTSYGNFALMDVLYFIIFNGIPLYLASITLDSRTVHGSNNVLIRLGKKVNYYRLTQYSFVIILFMYILIHLIIVAVYVLILNQKFEFSSYSNELFSMCGNKNLPYFVLILLGIALRIIELICVQKIIFFLYIKIKNLSIIFVFIIAGYFIIPFVGKGIYPLGLSSLLRMTSLHENPVISIFIIAIAYIVICISIDIYIKKKGIYNLLEM